MKNSQNTAQGMTRVLTDDLIYGIPKLEGKSLAKNSTTKHFFPQKVEEGGPEEGLFNAHRNSLYSKSKRLLGGEREELAEKVKRRTVILKKK